MDNPNSTPTDRRTSNVNGAGGRMSSPTPGMTVVPAGGRPVSLSDGTSGGGGASVVPSSGSYQMLKVVVKRDEFGYGMKVSGDNPVFVQSVKPGGAAERAGLHAGDRIVEVNGENVQTSTHTDVVALIRSSSQVILRVQHKTGGPRMGSPGIHARPLTAPHSQSRITAPQPVDNEKQHQLQVEREQYLRLMIEKEQRYIDRLRSKLAVSSEDKKSADLEKAERNLQKLDGMLQTHIKNSQSEPTNHTHQRTKSSPDSLMVGLTPAEASRRMIASESMNDLSRSEDYDKAMATPPGTPPPPYPSPLPCRKGGGGKRNWSNPEELDGSFNETPMDICVSSPDVSPLRGSGPYHATPSRAPINSSPIHAATPQTTQQSIISMEDDEFSEQDVSQLDDHGPFKSLSQLWNRDNLPYLAVFVNYVLSNSDPNSLLFYLITDLYKEGNLKEMRKWAYEIHSSFLVPGSPLRISNVEESVAHEIDDVLQKEHDKEEIMRKVFLKARNKAKEELTRQLGEYQQKRVAGLGTMFGPSDTSLAEICHDKVTGNAMKLYESLLERLDLDDAEVDNMDERKKIKFYTTSALVTVLTRIFGVRPPGNILEKYPVFVNKEKSIKPKFIVRNRKLNIQGHQFVAQQYYTVIRCNNCQQIIFGIGPQGYECQACHINLHRSCVRLYDDICPGPMTKKSVLKLMDRMVRHENKDSRRKHSTNFIQMEKERRLAEERDNGMDLSEIGDTKPGNPVTRTPSDRRPDAVREESSRSQTAHSQSQSNEAEAANTECTASLPASTGNKKKQNSNINRSESVKEQSEKNRKQRRNISDPTHINDRSELDNISAFHQQSGNSSNSCSSSSVSESPSSSLDPAGALSDGQCQKDSDMEVDVDPPNWKSALTEDQLRALQSHETTRQDVINEFFHTERSHLRNLKILNNVFRPEVSKVLTEDEMHLIFSNLRELVDVHNKFNSSMRERWLQKPIVMEVGDILLTMFDDELGNTLCAAASNFCGRQQIALDFIKEKRKKDTKFDSTLALCERNKSCRRLTLQDFLPQEMQRLAKYPLLIERLIDTEEESCRINAGKSTAELDKMKVALEKSRNILDKINEATKRFVSKHRLEEINAHLDNSLNDRIDSGFANEYRNFSLTRYTLIYDSTVTLKRAGKTPLQVHMILSEEAVILLQKESERYLLKFFHSNQATLQPIIRIQNVICRKNAADTHTLYLLSIHSNQMYEIQCPDANERKLWFKYLTDATEPYKSRSERNKKTQDHDDDAAVQALAMARSDAGERSDAVAAAGAATGTDDLDVPSSSSSTIGGGEQPNSQRNSDIVDDDATEKRLSLPEDVPVLQTAGNGVLEKVAANDWPLIQPSEVQVAIPPVHTAEPVLTPLEQIKRKDEEVRQALADKEVLVADLLSIPRDAYHHIADIASDESIQKTPSDREPSELVLAAVYQVSQLTAAVNESLNISETEHMAALGGKYPSCASNESSMIANNVPSVPTSKLQTIAATLNSQLTQLLSLVKQRDEERDILRRELYRTREQLHEKMNLHGSMVVDRNESIQLECTQSGDLESIEESPTETETT